MGAMTPPRSAGGFTIVSVLIAMVLLSVGILSVMTVSVQAFAMQTHGGTKSTALSIARSYMEEVRGREPTDLESEDAIQVNEDGQSDDTGVYTRELIVEDKSVHLMEVTVRVTYPGATKPLELVTLVYDQL